MLIILHINILSRLQPSTQRIQVQFILMDIPKISPDGTIKSSSTGKFGQGIRVLSDDFVDGVPLLADFNGVVDLHLSHGARHISEFTHIMLGLATAKKIDSSLTSTSR